MSSHRSERHSWHSGVRWLRVIAVLCGSSAGSLACEAAGTATPDGVSAAASPRGDAGAGERARPGAPPSLDAAVDGDGGPLSDEHAEPDAGPGCAELQRRYWEQNVPADSRATPADVVRHLLERGSIDELPSCP